MNISMVWSNRFLFIVLVAAIWFITNQETQAGPQSEVGIDLNLDRTSVPDLSSFDLTFLVDIGTAQSVNVSTNGTSVPFVYDPGSGQLRFTTSAEQVEIGLTGVADAAAIGPVEAATIKYDKSWAFSMGFDDNTGLKPTLKMIQGYGYRATLFMICEIIDDKRMEPWIIDKPDLLNYIADGWSIGNHTWDHSCDGSQDLTNTILDGYNRLAGIIAESANPDYKLIAFAAPCFISEYHPYILDMRDNGVTAVQFNESGGAMRIAVDPQITADIFLGDRFVHDFCVDRRVGRDSRLGFDPNSVIEEIDYMSANSNESLHLWYNTLAHGGNEANVQLVVDYIHTNYGTAGTDEVWIAPSDEIYSYLLVRDNSQISTAMFAAPSVIDIVNGLQVDGSLQDLFSSDDTRLILNSEPTRISEPSVLLEFEGETPLSNGTAMLRLESQASTPGLTRSVEAWNWQSNQYEAIDSSQGSYGADTSDEFLLGADHVNSNQGVRIRIGWTQTGIVFGYPWQVRIDRLSWSQQP